MTKQIKIEELIPFMRDGWLVMDNCQRWFWTSEKPIIMGDYWYLGKDPMIVDLGLCLDIAPAEDWTKSLIKIERK